MEASLANRAACLVPRDDRGPATHRDTTAGSSESSASASIRSEKFVATREATKPTPLPALSDHPEIRTCSRSTRAELRCQDARGQLDIYLPCASRHRQDRNK